MAWDLIRFSMFFSIRLNSIHLWSPRGLLTFSETGEPWTSKFYKDKSHGGKSPQVTFSANEKKWPLILNTSKSKSLLSILKRAKKKPKKGTKNGVCVCVCVCVFFHPKNYFKKTNNGCWWQTFAFSNNFAAILSTIHPTGCPSYS